MALTILCLFGLFAFSQAEVLKPFFDPRIMNGEDAKEGEIPYQVSLQNKDTSSHFCSGSIVTDNYVITAAHCVEGTIASEIKVIAGTIKLSNPKSEHDVAKVIVHKEYSSSNSWINDIALLKVKNPFIKSVNVDHVPLPPKDQVVNPNDIAVVSGWGRLWRGGPTTPKLQRINIIIVDQGYCKYVYNKLGYNVHPTQVCAYVPYCHGDSGGPLTVNGKLTGLASWPCLPTYPTVYTRVASYLDWIKQNAV